MKNSWKYDTGFARDCRCEWTQFVCIRRERPQRATTMGYAQNNILHKNGPVSTDVAQIQSTCTSNEKRLNSRFSTTEESPSGSNYSSQNAAAASLFFLASCIAYEPSCVDQRVSLRRGGPLSPASFAMCELSLALSRFLVLWALCGVLGIVSALFWALERGPLFGRPFIRYVQCQ